MPMIFFADRLRQLRLEREMNEGQMAQLLNCTPRTYQDYENGRLYPHAMNLCDIADYFNVSIDYLMGRTDRREGNP